MAVNHEVYESPNGEYSVRRDRFRTFRMGFDVSHFSLYRAKDLLIEFEFPAYDSVIWSADSQFFELPIYILEFGEFVFRIRDFSFALVRVLMCHPYRRTFEDGRLRLSYLSNADGYLNSPFVISSNSPDGSAPAEFPVKRMKAPPDLVLELSGLHFYKDDMLGIMDDMHDLLVKEPKHDMTLLEDGYFPFEGPMPQSTTQLINTRRMMIDHLEGFAGIGDRQSQVWLEEVKATGKPYYPLQEVSWYIGEKQRTIPVDTFSPPVELNQLSSSGTGTRD